MGSVCTLNMQKIEVTVVADHMTMDLFVCDLPEKQKRKMRVSQSFDAIDEFNYFYGVLVRNT
jgi:hypothetical protein